MFTLPFRIRSTAGYIPLSAATSGKGPPTGRLRKYRIILGVLGGFFVLVVVYRLTFDVYHGLPSYADIKEAEDRQSAAGALE